MSELAKDEWVNGVDRKGAWLEELAGWVAGSCVLAMWAVPG